MKYSSVQYARAFRELMRETPPQKRRALIRDFLAALAKNNCLSLLPEIVCAYGEEKARENGVRAVTVRAPERVSESEFARKLSFKAEVKSELDARLRGGVVLEVGDLRVDNSIAKRLWRVREALGR